MGALESNTTNIYGVHLRESANDGSDFSNAASDYRVLFLGEDGVLHVKDSAGTVTDAFTAGSGIAATIFDAKGDIIAASAADTAARLAVGSNWDTLVADSGQSTGLRWEGYVGAKAYHNTTEAINNTFFSMNSEDFDTDGFHDTGSNTSRMTIPSNFGGLYHVVGHWYTGNSTERACSLRLNGTTLIRGSYSAAAFGGVTSAYVVLAATDYVELFTTENTTFGHATNPERMNSLTIVKVK